MNSEARRVAQRRYTKTHKGRITKRRYQQSPQGKAKKQASTRKSALKCDYGLTQAQFENLAQKQNNRCAICQTEFTNTPHIDHNHLTNEIRGLLCGSCNRGIGLFHDDPKRTEAATRYLTDTQTKNNQQT